MDDLVRTAAVVIGIWLILGTGLSALRTMVLPRAARSVLTTFVLRTSRRAFLAMARGSFDRQDRVLALYTPFSLLLLAWVWVALLIVGFGLIFWALGHGTLADSLWISGSSLVTLGTAAPRSGTERVVGVVEATIGLGVVTLLVAFLPTLYGAFARRERMVTLLETAAGSPPSPVVMLARLHTIGMLTSLGDTWETWQGWFVEIDESHTSYPSLIWLRSPVPAHSWVTAAATVLDAASLWCSVVDAPPDPRAQLCIRSGYVALRRISGFFRFEFDPDPAPTDPISVTRAQFDEAVARLAASGLALRDDLDQAWRDFAGWRVNYDSVLGHLVRITLPPPGHWIQRA